MLLRPVLMPILRNPLQGIADGIRNMLAELLGSSQFFAPLTHSLVLARGTGSPTFTRASEATFRDWEGVLRTVPSGCARFEGARMVRNVMRKSEDFSGAEFTKTNCTVAKNLEGPDGAANSACTVTATGASALLYDTQGITPASCTKAVTSLHLKRITGTGTIQISANGANTNVTVALTTSWQRFEASATTLVSGTFPAILIATSGDIIGVAFWQEEDVTGQADQTASEYVSVGVESAPYHGAGVDGVEFFPTDRDGAVIPAATNTGYLAETADVLAYPTASNILAAASTVYLEFTPDHTPSGTIALWGTYVDASNYTAILHDATNMIMRKRIAGVNYDATIANAFTANTTYKVCGSWGASGVTITLDGTEGTLHANTTAAQIAATMQWGADGNSLQQPFATERNARVWQRQLSASERGAITA